MSALTPAHVHAALRHGVDVMAKQQRADGAIVNPAWGLDDPSHCGTALFVAACAKLRLVEPAVRGADYLLRYQRPSGLIDMRSCNFDSAPDTGFVVQLLA
jgi:hypothetical protein